MGDETIIKTGLLQIDQSFLTWMVEVSEEMQNSMQVLSFNETIKHRIMFFRTLSKYALIQEKNYASFFSQLHEAKMTQLNQYDDMNRHCVIIADMIGIMQGSKSDA